MTRKWFSYLLLILAISLLSCTKGLDFSRPYIELTVISDDSPDTTTSKGITCLSTRTR